MTPREKVKSYAWLAADESGLSEAGCVTVTVGADTDAVAAAFGMDREQRANPADNIVDVGALTPAAAPSSVVVIEDNGYEGSREVVLKQASRAGKAASVCWNVNGLVVFSCARRGKILYSDELGNDEHLPRSLLKVAALLEDEAPVAVGAAMVEAFTGVAFAFSTADLVWHPLDPPVGPADRIVPASSGLRDDYPDLLDALVALPGDLARPLVRSLVVHTVRRAGLGDDPVVMDLLAKLPEEGPGIATPALERAQREENRVSFDLWSRHEDATNAGGVPPRPDEEVGHRFRSWTLRALRHASSPDDLTALLGCAHDAVVVHGMDGLQGEFAATLIRACGQRPTDWDSSFALLPAPPSSDERRRQLQQMQQDFIEDRRRRIREFEESEGVVRDGTPMIWDEDF